MSLSSTVRNHLVAHWVTILSGMLSLAWVTIMATWSIRMGNLYMGIAVGITAVSLALGLYRRRRVIRGCYWMSCPPDRMNAILVFCLTNDIPFEIKYTRIGFIDESDLVRVNLSV
jgi:hypothetical protein